MISSSGVIVICLAYILGVALGSSFPDHPHSGCILFILGIILSILVFKLQKKAFKNEQIKYNKLAAKYRPANRKKPRKKTEKSDAVSETPDLKPIAFEPLISFLPSSWRWWISAGVVGWLASFYFVSQIPQPAPNDISQFLKPQNGILEQPLLVWGKVLSEPRITRSGRAQFWLEANSTTEVVGQGEQAEINQAVGGKLYVTSPLLQATGVHPGYKVEMNGILYQPQPAANPGGFDFQKYLAKEGAFAGFTAQQLEIKSTAEGMLFNFWPWRDRILQFQVEKLGVPEGVVLSAIVLGRKAVELPYRIRDQFIQVGMAHVVAASGFHVSLLLGLVLFVVQKYSPGVKFSSGIIVLLLYICLTGFSASVLRAFLMGSAALLGLVRQQKVEAVSALIISGTLLLLNPLLIEDLGFQMSFLATWGLLVTVPPIQRRLDWLPPALCSLIAVPLAASVWVLPIQLHTFGVIAPYSILVNIISAPMVWLISLGGMISAGVGLIVPVVGSYLAWCLYFPIHSLLELIKWFSELPGNQVAVGSLSLLQVIALYLILGLICLWGIGIRRKIDYFAAFPELIPRGKNGRLMLPKIPLWGRWWVAGFLAVVLVVAPGFYIRISRLELTVLEAGSQPILVVQDRGFVTLVNSGNENTVRFTILPFLQKQGISKIDWFIALDQRLSVKRGWEFLGSRLPITKFSGNFKEVSSEISSVPSFLTDSIHFELLTVGKSEVLGSLEVKLIDGEIPVFQVILSGKTWLFLGDISHSGQLETDRVIANMQLNLPEIDVLWWPGQDLPMKILEQLKPAVAIASSQEIDENTGKILEGLNTQVFWTGRDGALQWTPVSGVRSTSHLGEME